MYELLDERRRLRRLTYVMDCPALGLLPTMQSGKLFGVPAGEIATAYLNLFPKDRNVSALLLCKNTYIVNSVAFS